MIYKLKENRVLRTYNGGKKIDEFYNKTQCINSCYPEDWTASVTTVFNDEKEGLGITEDGIPVTDIVGADKLNILVKLLHSAERLVIQAHPTVEFAKKYLNSDYGKTECWYFLECDSNACVYIGFKEGIEKSDWEQAFCDGNSEAMLSMLHCLSVKEGDFIFVDGGVPHAIGAGCFIIELQEPSDFMVVNERFTASGCEIAESRIHMGLGYKKMFDVYDYIGYSYDEIKQKFCPEKKSIADNVYELAGEELTDKFSMYLMQASAVFKSSKKYKIMIVISGEGIIGTVNVKRGDRLIAVNEDFIQIKGNNDFKIIVCE